MESSIKISVMGIMQIHKNDEKKAHESDLTASEENKAVSPLTSPYQELRSPVPVLPETME